MISILLAISLVLSGCCVKQRTLSENATAANFQGESSEMPEIFESTEAESNASEDSEYMPLSLEQKWQDFRKRSSISRPEDLLYYAEELYDSMGSHDVIRRMELAFFISQVYKRKGNTDKAKIFSQHYLEHLQAQKGGKSFKSHQSNQSAVKEIMKKIKEKEIDLDE